MEFATVVGDDEDGTDCGCCIDGDEIWSADYDGADGCNDESATLYISECAQSISIHWDPASTGDRLLINGDDVGGCECDRGIFGCHPIDVTLDVSSTGSTITVEVEGCCHNGDRRSSYSGYITVNC